MDIAGAWLVTPTVIQDERGQFLEWFKQPAFSDSVGAPLALAQANCSVSTRGVVRGIHFTVPPVQAKYVTCVRGAIQDVVVDVRLGSPTFGAWQSVRLSDRDRRAVYLSEGLGHGFAALEDHTTVIYLCTAGYDPARERAVHPLDPAMGIEWDTPTAEPTLSRKDRAAPTLAQSAAEGKLPSWEAQSTSRGRPG